MSNETSKRTNERREHFVYERSARDARSLVSYQQNEYGRKVVACRRVDPMDQSRGYIVTTEPRRGVRR